MNKEIGLTSGERQFLERGVKISHEHKYDMLLILLALGFLTTLICYFYVVPNIDIPTAHAESTQKGYMFADATTRKQETTVFCKQARTDHKLTGEPMGEALKSLCV